MNYSITLFIFVVSLLCIGCPDNDPADSELSIANNSSTKLIYFIQINEPIDTLLSTFAFPLTPENTKSRVINPDESVVLKEGFKRILSGYRNKVLMLYLFTRDTIEQISWDQIVDDYMILGRYDLTLEDLERLNWTINYP